MTLIVGLSYKNDPELDVGVQGIWNLTLWGYRASVHSLRNSVSDLGLLVHLPRFSIQLIVPGA